jgi:putative two-component system response regulator
MKEEKLTNARILIVDDQESNVQLLEHLLGLNGFQNYRSTTDSRQVLPFYSKFQPDLILLDLMMPHLDGYSVLQQLQSRIPDGTYLPVIVLTADMTPEAKKKALSMGAKDFLTKPLDATEVLLRIKNLLETRFLYRRLQDQHKTLEEALKEHTEELWQSHVEVLHRLAMASEYLEDNTGQHGRRVGETSAILARAIGLPKAQAELIGLAAPLHDVGKVGIPARVLTKTDKPTPEELEQMKAHTTIGARILSGTQIPLLQLAEEIALYHHEHWDGSGYARLTGESIPIAARIVAVADVFDVLTHGRSRGPAKPAQEAAGEIERESGRKFDPRLVQAFLRWRRREELPQKLMETVLNA